MLISFAKEDVFCHGKDNSEGFECIFVKVF